jgi:hypothetical protein
MQGPADSSVSAAEKLPIDVIVLIYHRVLENSEFHRCPCCKRVLSIEASERDLCSMKLVCRKWRMAWARLLISCHSTERFPFCTHPIKCFSLWYKLYYEMASKRRVALRAVSSTTERDVHWLLLK